LLYVFHRRIHQLILGAEVTKILGLKSIPAKTLALCSQVLFALVELIPYLRAALHPYMNSPKHFASLQLLDNASDDINVHIRQIFEKFVSIITERLQAHLGDSAAYQQALLQQHQNQPGKPEECSAQMARFLKELCSLHRVLDQYLSPEQMRDVFSLVFGNVERVYSEVLSGCDAANKDVVSMLELDVKKLCSTAEGLKNSPMKLTVIENTLSVMKEMAPEPETTRMTVEEGSDEEKGPEPTPEGTKESNAEVVPEATSQVAAENPAESTTDGNPGDGSELATESEAKPEAEIIRETTPKGSMDAESGTVSEATTEVANS